MIDDVGRCRNVPLPSPMHVLVTMLLVTYTVQEKGSSMGWKEMLICLFVGTAFDDTETTAANNISS